MIHLIERLWPALAVAAALGFVFAAIGGPGRRFPSAGWPTRVLVLALLAGVAVASALRIVPGAVGLWLDLGILIGVAYLAGVVAGSGLRRLVDGRASEQLDDPSASVSPDAAAPRATPAA